MLQFRGLSDDQDAKKDINMHTPYQMTNINPTPFDTLSMVRELQNSGNGICTVIKLLQPINELLMMDDNSIIGFTTDQAQGLVRVLLSIAVYSSEQALSGHISHSTLVRT